MKRTFMVAWAMVAMATVALVNGPARAEYPERPIQVIVPWSAGGGTDATGRMIAKIMQDELGVPVNVVNRTGGGGVVGHQAIASAKPDGYTIGIVTVEIAMMHWIGLTELSYKDYTPIALYNADPAGVSVNIDSKYNDVGALLADAKANPGKMKASGTGQGGIWHLALAGMLVEAGMESSAIGWVPSQGAAPAFADLAAGGIDTVTASVVEARALMEAGKVKVLAVMNDKRLDAFPNIPTLTEAGGPNWQTAAWRTVAGPKGLPADVQAKLAATVEKVYNSQEFKDFMAGRGFGMIWGGPDALAKHYETSDADYGKVLKAVGLAK
ncbi:tripartite tricarboxylate transporter substrate binding protein [Thalassobaculum sp. OXR-137]|uniref:tripartite tricarboxylate transporter substrate binding protein n=1 Tax=Thalassobaculum sp. OXR-137 TaxID=3100173 RepID=UPI002AC8B4A3|nr:tripartite tricarboxylate transporter substrate binding protein [Thalassobaculum sp. OXR-137]WPZ36101.1 tripartite tricarboxylate transporter substrate binding protein [Thalassobaculum sp. OXR-137]